MASEETAPRKRKSRSPKANENRLMRKWVGFFPDLWFKIESYRIEHLFGTESKAIRQLIMEGFAAIEARGQAAETEAPSNARGAYARMHQARMSDETRADYNRAVLVDVADLYQYQDGRMKPCRHSPSSSCDKWNCLKDGCHRANALLNNFPIGKEAASQDEAA